MARRYCNQWGRLGVWCALVGVIATGCAPPQTFRGSTTADLSYFKGYAQEFEYPAVDSRLDPSIAAVSRPLALENPAELPVWELPLSEAVERSLESSQVLRSSGASVVQAIGGFGVFTPYDPAMAEADPLGGVEAALSAFDTQVSTQLFWQKNNVPNNTELLFIFPFALEQTAGNFAANVSKQTALGTQFSLRHNVGYDRNNSPGRLFQSAFIGWFEAEMRQPLMQGAGLTFNRIAGPNARPGQYNGVLIARINTDISLTEFERNVIQLVSDVEQSYWELYFAYRNLDALVAGRENALRTWQRVKALESVGARGGEADAEAQAASNYYDFDTRVQEALSGRNGLYATEQRLRYLIGSPPTDGRLIRPSDQPLEAEVIIDWEAAVADALMMRTEIRRQKWQIKRRELELVAARMNRRPRLDVLTLYRWRGLGNHLVGTRDPDNSFNSLYQNILEGDFQEWQAGFELGYPVGLRQASAAVRHAQLALAREQAFLQEKELRISHDLSQAARDIARAYQLLQTNYNRLDADRRQVEVLRNRFEGGLTDINFLLQAQQALAAAEGAFYRSLTDYSLAVRDFHREKGSLLAYNQIQLAEGPWAQQAYADARLRSRHLHARGAPEQVMVQDNVSLGEIDPSSVGR